MRFNGYGIQFQVTVFNGIQFQVTVFNGIQFQMTVFNGIQFQVTVFNGVSKCSLYTFYNNPAPLNGSMPFHYCTDSNPGTGADDAFVLKHSVWRNATWPSHSRPAIAASARHFQICFLP